MSIRIYDVFNELVYVLSKDSNVNPFSDDSINNTFSRYYVSTKVINRYISKPNPVANFNYVLTRHHSGIFTELRSIHHRNVLSNVSRELMLIRKGTKDDTAK